MEEFSFAEIRGMTMEGPSLASQYKRAGSSSGIDAAVKRLMIFVARTPGYPLELLAAHVLAASEAKKLLVEHEAKPGTIEPNLDPKTARARPINFVAHPPGWEYAD